MNILELLEKNLDKRSADPQKQRSKTSALVPTNVGLAEVSRGAERAVGLSSKEAAQRQEKFGKNELQHKKTVHPGKIFLNQYKDVMTLILLACTVVSVLMGEYVEAVSIAVIILMNGILGFVQEYKTERTLQALKAMATPQATAIRDGVVRSVPALELVVDDVILVKSGDKIPADCILIDSTALQSDESMLTGESVPVSKTEGEQLFMGCSVTKGHCTARVTAIGMNTKMGDIALMLQDIEEEPTPLQKRLATLSKYIAVGCLLICSVVTVTGILRGEPLMQMLITGVSLAVAAVPEGLPAIVTISLALSVSRMVKRRALVRRLHAVEALGCATVICSDKTGTITQNKMTATQIYTTSGVKPADSISGIMLDAITTCNNAAVTSETEFGDSTEVCLLRLAGVYRPSKYTREDEQPFDSTRKRMSVVVRNEQGERFMFVKGAFDILVECCDSIQVAGKDVAMTQALRHGIEAENVAFGDNALRVLCVAYKKITALNNSRSESNLTFLGLIGMIDPARPEVRGAVLSCHKAGIKTVMITGDHKNTAVAIAREVGIYHEGDMVLSGSEVDTMTLDSLSEIVNKVTVFARVSPAHKLMIVRALKRHGHIVAMTGDGVNDAPAIKEADIGVSMGLSGTDVTREASEIVLLDDNFATLVNAIDEGRSIYANIRKFIRYLLACNIGEVITMFLGMIMGMPIILFPIQILFVNLVTDGLPAIALGLEPTDPRAMSVPPRRGNESVFSNGLATKIVIRGILIGLTTLATFVTLFSMTRSEDVARSGALFALIFAQLIHVFECKSEDCGLFGIHIFNNMKLILATLVSLTALLLILYLPQLQLIFLTVPLTLKQALVPIGYCLVAPIIVAISKGKRAA